VVLLNGVTPIQTINATADVSGNVSQIVVIGSAPTPTLTVMALTATGVGATLTVECAELLKYKPWEVDAYAVLRLASATPTGQLLGNLDGSGLKTVDASAVASDYFASGCITGQNLPDEVGIGQVNTNGVYESWRAMTRFVRCVKRDAVVGYGYDGTSTTIWFKRYTAVGETFADCFEGIAPAPAAVTFIRPGIPYVATGGTVVYPPIGQPGSASYTAGTNFTGIFGQTEIGGTSTGTAWEREGIIRGEWANGTPVNNAPASGTTNQWLMFPQFSTYNWGSETGFAPSVYADRWPMPERCLMFAPLSSSYGPIPGTWRCRRTRRAR